jgi:hypothetical protein
VNSRVVHRLPGHLTLRENYQDLMDSKKGWLDLYQAAILETNDRALGERISAAKHAIEGRLQELALDHQGTLREKQQISDALAGLQILEKERLGPNDKNV